MIPMSGKGTPDAAAERAPKPRRNMSNHLGLAKKRSWKKLKREA
jgi:hypothetical protein